MKPKYERPITDENFELAEKRAIELHKRAARKRYQSSLIRHVSIYTVALTILLAVYTVFRFLGIGTNTFGSYDALGPLNAVCDVMFTTVLDVSSLWYVRWPLFVFEAAMIPVAIAGLLALVTCRRPMNAPEVHGRSNRAKALVLRDFFKRRDGFAKEAMISAVIVTLVWIAFSAYETIMDASRDTSEFVIGPGAAGVKHFLLVSLGVIAAAFVFSLISFAFCSVFYYDDGRDATLMMSDLCDYLDAHPDGKAEKGGAPAHAPDGKADEGGDTAPAPDGKDE